MVGTIVHQLTNGVCPAELEKAGLGPYYTDHGWGVYPQAAAGFPFTASVLAVKGDPIADLQEDLAAEQKARATYEKLIDLSADNPDVVDPLRFLREREVVHFQRFGEALRNVQDKLAQKKFYTSNKFCDNNPCKCMKSEVLGVSEESCGCGLNNNMMNNSCGCNMSNNIMNNNCPCNMN